MSRILYLPLEPTDTIKKKADEICLEQQREIQLLCQKIARVQKDAENMAADFQKERELLERQESHASSNEGGTINFVAWAAKAAASVALQVGGAAGFAYIYGRFILPVPIPPPPPDAATRVLTAVVNLFKHFH